MTSGISSVFSMLFTSTADTGSYVTLRSRFDKFTGFLLESGLPILRSVLISLFRFSTFQACELHVHAGCQRDDVDDMGMGPFTQVEGGGQLSDSWPHD